MSRIERRPKLALKMHLAPPSPHNEVSVSQGSSHTGLPASPRDTLQLPADRCVSVHANELCERSLLGRGTYGTVYHMTHCTRPDISMAVKRVPVTLVERERDRLLMDLDVCRKASPCAHTVQFYGALHTEGHVWICMELMDASMDQVCDCGRLASRLPQGTRLDDLVLDEAMLLHVCYSTVSALQYLHTQLRIIHRDVKPSNILCNRRAQIKLCDFGIAGHLIDSVARTVDAGCKPYMAPERVDPSGDKSYDIRSDVWSLGISLLEMSTGRPAYMPWSNDPFQQLKQIVHSPSPQLTPCDSGACGGRVYSVQFCALVNSMLHKRCECRPNHEQILAAGCVSASHTAPVHMSALLTRVLDTLGK